MRKTYCPYCFSEMEVSKLDYTRTLFIAICTNKKCRISIPCSFLSGYWSCARDILHYGKLEKIRESIRKMDADKN